MSTITRPAPAARENVNRLVPYPPGKPTHEVTEELGLSRVVKLASNENAMGPSPFALQAIHEFATQAFLYPDVTCRALRNAVAASLHIPADHLIFGNGSDEILQVLGLTYLEPGDETVQASPSFPSYASAAVLNGALAHKTALCAWTTDLEAMADKINAKTRLIFIANPNNPTGTIVTSEVVRNFLDRVPDRALVVFDEAYYEYVDHQDYPDTLGYVREGRNVIVLRTFSKAYGLAGLRLGYGVARPEIIAPLNCVRLPFNVNRIAQEAGIAALKDVEHLARTQAMNRNGREQFYTAFRTLGLSYAPTQANFVWVDVGRDGREVYQSLLQLGVIVRPGDNFGAPTCLRVTIGTAEENEIFLNALSEVLAEKERV